MTLPRHIANEIGIVMDEKPKARTPQPAPRRVMEVIDNDDGSKTVLYFGKQVGHIYKIGIRTDTGVQYRAITNYDDVRHFHNLQSAASYLMASHH